MKNIRIYTMYDIFSVQKNKNGKEQFNRHALPKLCRNDAKNPKPEAKVKGTSCTPHKDSLYWS